MSWMPPTDFSGDLAALNKEKEERLERVGKPKPEPESEEKSAKSRVPGMERARKAGKALRLIVKYFGLTKAKIGPELGAGESFYAELQKKDPARWARSYIPELAKLFGFNMKEFCRLDGHNFHSCMKKMPPDLLKRLRR